MKVPTFLVAGGARCGTTAVIEGLRACPGVFVTTPKEPHYFAFHRIGAQFNGPGDDSSINRVAVTDRTAYLALYEPSAEDDARGEGSVSTLYFADEAAPEILSMNPDMRIVVLLREPVERAYSAYQYMRARGLEQTADFMQAVAQEPARQGSGWQHIWHYTGMSRYVDSIQQLQNALGPRRVGIWFYDDLNSDYAGTLRSILQFIGAPPPPDGSIDMPRVNVSGKPRVERLSMLLMQAAGNDRIRSTVKRTTSFRLRESVRRRLVTSAGIPEEARERLSPMFAEDLARLRDLLPGPGPSWLQRE